MEIKAYLAGEQGNEQVTDSDYIPGRAGRTAMPPEK